MNPYVVCIGATILDITGFTPGPLILGDKNSDGFVALSSGGAARNIAENLARMGVDTKLLTVLGDDAFGAKIRTDGEAAGIDMGHLDIIPGRVSPTYLALIDGDGVLSAGVTDLHICEEYTVAYFQREIETIRGAAMVVMTPEIPDECLRYLHAECPEVPIMVDVAAVGLAEYVKRNFGVYHTIKANNYEVQALTGIDPADDKAMHEAADYLIDRGTTCCIFTVGEGGLFYKDSSGKVIRTATKPLEKVVSATGAGDAVTAGYVWSVLNGKDVQYALNLGMGAAMVALSYEKANDPNLSPERAYEAFLAHKL